MERATHYRPRISRETRLLVTTALLAVLALWMLARLRFPALPAEPRAISQLLTSLGTGADFEGLASQIVRVRGLVGPYLSSLEFDVPEAGGVSTSRAAFRVGGDIAIVLVPDGGRLRPSSDATLLAFDAASRLAVVRLSLDPATSGASPRVTGPPEPPQYVVATSIYPDGVALRPVFLAAMAEVDAPLWSATAWAVPPETGLTPGAFVFTRDGELAGLTTLHQGMLALVSSETVLDEANRLIGRPSSPAGSYRVQVEPMTPTLERALGAGPSGVVVTWVDPDGPARGVLMAGDVIETVGGRSMPTIEHWQRHLATLTPGAPVALSLRRAGGTRTVNLTPAAEEVPDEQAARAGQQSLGAGTRAVRGAGTEILSVESGSIAARAGLQAGDVITSVGEVQSPPPSVVARAAASLKEGQSVLLGVRRGNERRLLVLER